MSNEINTITDIEEAEALIAAEEEKKQSVYLEIGKLYFIKHSTDPEPEFKPLVDELVAASGKIAELDQRLNALKNGPICPECGMPVNEDSVFCSSCGARLKEAEPVEEPEPDPSIIICPRCGSEMRKDMRFCTACGNPLSDPAPVPAQPEPEPEPAAEPDFITCPQCGNEMKKDMRFCISCGNPLSDLPSAPLPEPEPIDDPEPYYAPESDPEPDPYEPESYDQESYEQETYDQEPYEPDYDESDSYEPEAYDPEPAQDTDPYYPPEPAAQSDSYVAPEPANICPMCGSVSEAGIRFCTNCGYCLIDDGAPAVEPAEDFSVRRCPNCGFISPDPNMAFCTECGTPLN